MTEPGETKGHYRVHRDATEMKRLDDMHTSVKAFRGGKNIPVPLETPRSILEVGGGSGIWAKEVAEAYPQAAVAVVDIAQVPLERLPSNCIFYHLDITKEFPFALESFDLIHTRFVIMHIPHAEDVVRNLITAVKPGGYLILEEALNAPTTADGGPLPPATEALFEFWKVLVKQGGADAFAGSKLEDLLKSSTAFSEVENSKYLLPMTPWSEDPELNDVGVAIKRGVAAGLSTVFKHLDNEPRAAGLLESALQEMDDQARKMGFEMYFIRAKKKQ